MNLALFFEGTGQGVRGKRTNVSLVYEACLEDDAQRRHLEAGPGAHIGALVLGKTSGVGWRMIFARARRWYEAQVAATPSGTTHSGSSRTSSGFCVPHAASSRHRCDGTNIRRRGRPPDRPRRRRWRTTPISPCRRARRASPRTRRAAPPHSSRRTCRRRPPPPPGTAAGSRPGRRSRRVVDASFQECAKCLEPCRGHGDCFRPELLPNCLIEIDGHGLRIGRVCYGQLLVLIDQIENIRPLLGILLNRIVRDRIALGMHKPKIAVEAKRACLSPLCATVGADERRKPPMARWNRVSPGW